MRRKDDEKEQRIKDAVIEVVLKEGFGGASISKIAKCAGVSPATVYIYHENKESMLQSIYVECAEEMYDVLLSGVYGMHDGRQIVETLIRSYYQFVIQHEKLFSFVEQFASSPALTHNCSEIKGFEKLMGLVQEWQEEKIFRPYQTINVYALLFHPVKMLAAGTIAYHAHADAAELLRELIQITQDAILTE